MWIRLHPTFFYLLRELYTLLLENKKMKKIWLTQIFKKITRITSSEGSLIEIDTNVIQLPTVDGTKRMCGNDLVVFWKHETRRLCEDKRKAK